MKKLLLIAVLLVTSLAGYSQILGSGALIGKIGYQTDYDRVMLGIEGRYGFLGGFRIAPDVHFYFPNDHTTGLDVDVNLHYAFNIPGDFQVYPLAGLAIQNNRWSHDGDSDSWTDFGFNLGGGIDYSFSPRAFVSIQAKYTFSDNDNALFSIGYGYRF